MQSETRNPQSSKDHLWLHLRGLPYFRALLRAVEARVYDDVELPAPTLDLGCGDGHFAALTFDRPLEVGLDPWEGPLREAAGRGAYDLLTLADGGKMPFPDDHFASAVSNSVLEHIPQVDDVLVELARVLKPGGRFVFCVPSHNFTQNLSVARFLDALRLRPLAQAYRDFFNRISRHEHTDSPEVWVERLENAGFTVQRWWHYFSPGALRVLEWGHYFGLPSWVSRALFGRWILSPTRWNLALTRKYVQPYYDEPPECEDGAYTFYLTQRTE